MSDGAGLSVVVPSHDTRELTLRCLASLAAQDVAAEVILVDDASSDGTADAVGAAFPLVRVMATTAGSAAGAAVGFGAAANQGLAAAGGDVLLLLNADTEVDPGALRALLAGFAARPRLGAGGAVLRYPDGAPQWNGGTFPTVAWLFALASAWPSLAARLPGWRRLRPASRGGDVEWITGAALALRRAAWSEAGPLDEGYRFYAQDLDLCTRLAQTGWEIAVIPGFTVLHHHGASIGQRPGARARRENPELLWRDLLRWSERHRGASWTRRARRALLAGGRLRLAATRFGGASAGDREALRRAVRAVRDYAAPTLGPEITRSQPSNHAAPRARGSHW